jgi:hypothetical protein
VRDASRRLGNIYNRLSGHDKRSFGPLFVGAGRQEDAILWMDAVFVDEGQVKVRFPGVGIVITVAPVVKVHAIAVGRVEVFTSFGAGVTLCRVVGAIAEADIPFIE